MHFVLAASAMVNSGNSCYELGSFLGSGTDFKANSWMDRFTWTCRIGQLLWNTVGKPFLVINVNFLASLILTMPSDIYSVLWCWCLYVHTHIENLVVMDHRSILKFFTITRPSILYTWKACLVCFWNPRNLSAPCLFRWTWSLLNVCAHM
jgi:hypothetical protein